MNYKDYFKDKNIAIIGLGAYGEMIPDIRFLKALKANITIYETKSSERLKPLLSRLSTSILDKMVYGPIKADDLATKDTIILSSEISSKSHFLKKAREANIPIEYQEIIFLKLCPNITLVGVAGSYGKTAIATLIDNMFKKTFTASSQQAYFYINHESKNGCISNLKKIKSSDVVLSEIGEHMIKEYRSAHINPHIAVITSLTSIGEGSENEVFGLLEHQTYNNFIIAPDSVIDVLRNRAGFTARAKIFRTRVGLIPGDWEVSKKHNHEKENASLALQVSEIFKVDRDLAHKIIDKFDGIKGHMEFIKKVRGVDFYNDGASVNPESTKTAIENLSKENPEGVSQNIILIIGGAYTGYEYTKLVKTIQEKVKLVICLPGSATVGFRNQILELKNVDFKQVLDLKEAVEYAVEVSNKGDKVLFSPACIALGVFSNRNHRIDSFSRLVRKLK